MQMVGGNPTGGLTERELQVLLATCDGRSSTQIGLGLKLSPQTVEVHRNNLFRKTGNNNIVALVRWAIRNDLIEP